MLNLELWRLGSWFFVEAYLGKHKSMCKKSVYTVSIDQHTSSLQFVDWHSDETTKMWIDLTCQSTKKKYCPHWLHDTSNISTGAHLVFLQSCSAVAFLQEDKCIFVEWIFTFTHVWRTTKNPLIYLSYPSSDFTATCCSKVQYIL